MKTIDVYIDEISRLLPPFYFNRTILPAISSPVLVDTLMPGPAAITQIPAPFSVMADNRLPWFTGTRCNPISRPSE